MDCCRHSSKPRRRHIRGSCSIALVQRRWQERGREAGNGRRGAFLFLLEAHQRRVHRINVSSRDRPAGGYWTAAKHGRVGGAHTVRKVGVLRGVCASACLKGSKQQKQKVHYRLEEGGEIADTRCGFWRSHCVAQCFLYDSGFHNDSHGSNDDKRGVRGRGRWWGGVTKLSTGKQSTRSDSSAAPQM